MKLLTHFFAGTCLAGELATIICDFQSNWLFNWKECACYDDYGNEIAGTRQDRVESFYTFWIKIEILVTKFWRKIGYASVRPFLYFDLNFTST